MTLPADDRPRTPPADATAQFVGVQPATSFDALAAQVVASVERQHPAEEGSRLNTESASAASATTGTVAVRRHGFSDDSLAGYEYRVTVEESGGLWTVVSATRSAICYRGVTGGLCV